MFKVLLLSLLASASAHSELISTGVGMVRGKLVTSRQVQIQNLLEVALYEKEPKDKLKLLALDSKAFAKATQDTLLEAVVALEAQNFNVIQVAPEEVQAAEKSVLKVFKDLKAWKSLEVSPKELDSGLKNKIQGVNYEKKYKNCPVFRNIGNCISNGFCLFG